MGHTYSNNLFHIIFSTKDRRNLLTDKNREEVHRYITGIIRNLDCKLLRINSVGNHVHLLCKIKPSIAVSDFVSKIKSNSSRWIKERFDNCPDDLPALEGDSDPCMGFVMAQIIINLEELGR